MAATGQGVNILRYGALFFGAFYGFTHQRTLHTDAAKATAEHEKQSKADLIARAKKEWTRKNSPAVGGGAGDGDVISDPDDPKFDLEAWLTMQQKSSA